MSDLQNALSLASRGFYIFELDHPELPKCAGVRTKLHDPDSCSQRGKHPACKWSDRATIDTKEIIAMFTGHPRNVGIACGPSHLLVVDEDGLGELARFAESVGASIPATFTVTTGNGKHYYFRMPDGLKLGNKEGALRSYKINIRGVGGYVVGPGSLHESGVIYQIDNPESAISAAPEWLVNALQAQPGADQHGTGPSEWWASGVIHHPQRHNAMIASAGTARHHGLTIEQAWPMVREVWSRCCHAECCAEHVYSEADARARLADVYQRYEAGHATGTTILDDEDDPAPAPMALNDVHKIFRQWLGDSYEIDVLNAVLATAVAERLAGDPLWLLVISGPGNAKTETVQALSGAGAFVTSTIASEGALLSGTPRREKAKDATGGLLRRIGSSGVLVVKDVTSILSANRDTRAMVLAAMREVYDGFWERNIGSDGGRSLTWRGRIVVVGAVTTAWDRAHDVISTLGDRFVLVRSDSHEGRLMAGRHAIDNKGAEVIMRQELANAAGAIVANVDPRTKVTLTETEVDHVLRAADLVTLARTGVDYDYRGDVIDSHAPEMPTRFAKQLAQLMSGAVAMGMDRADTLRLAIRCARDSMPPLRLAIIDDLAVNPHSRPGEIRRRLEKPKATVDRQCQALHILGVLTCDEIETGSGASKHYSIADGIDPGAIS